MANLQVSLKKFMFSAMLLVTPASLKDRHPPEPHAVIYEYYHHFTRFPAPEEDGYHVVQSKKQKLLLNRL